MGRAKDSKSDRPEFKSLLHSLQGWGPGQACYPPLRTPTLCPFRVEMIPLLGSQERPSLHTPPSSRSVCTA